MSTIQQGCIKNAQALYKNESGSYSVRGVHPDHQFLENSEMIEGRYINEKDIIGKTRVTVIGRLVEEDLFKKEKALGKFLELNGITYKVVGVFSDAGGDNEERMIYTPVSTTQLIHLNTDYIDHISLSYNREIGVEGARKMAGDISKFLKEKHFVAEDDRSGIFVRSVFENFEQNMQFANVLQLIVLWIGVGTLFAGAIGIGNIMVFVVKERTKELGIRKALGATPASIVGLILQEIDFYYGSGGLSRPVDRRFYLESHWK